MVLDENGEFDIVRARETGGIHALGRLKVIKTTRTYKDGTIDEIVRHEFSLRDKNLNLQLLGKHHGLWTDEYEDPDDLISEALGIPKHLLPSTFDEPGSALGEILEPDKKELAAEPQG